MPCVPATGLAHLGTGGVAAVQELGFEGCAHASLGGNRQVLLVDRETLDALALGPGMIRENITTDGLNVNGLRLGGNRSDSAMRFLKW